MSTSISTTEIGLPDNAKLKLGTGEDLQIYHDGTRSFIDNNTGDLRIRSDDVQIRGINDELIAVFYENSSVDLYHNGSKKFETYQYGVNFSGTAKIESGGNFYAHDNIKFLAGTGEDLQIYHDSTHSYLSNGTGNLFVEIPDGQKFQVQHGSEAIINGYADGRVEIYHDNSKKLETISTGLNVTGGVRLGGNNSANELDDYEEGSFTPTLTTQNSLLSASYINQDAKYTKIGNFVHFQIYIRLSSKSGGSGHLRVSNLPFTSSNESGAAYGGGVVAWTYNWSGDKLDRCMVGSNSNQLQLFIGTNGGTNANAGAGNLNNDTQIRVFGSYRV